MNVQVRDTPAGNTLGDRLRRAREDARFTRPQLSTATHIPAKSIEKFEANDQEPSVSRLITLASTLGVSLDQLLGQSSTGPALSAPAAHVPQDADTVADILAELDELRESGFQYAQRRAMALVAQLAVELRYLEPRELLDLARERGVAATRCPSALELQNALTADAVKGQERCSEVEQRIIDTALLGADLPAVEGTHLAGLADQLKLEGGGMWGWKAESEGLADALRAPLRQLAFAGKGVSLRSGGSGPRRG